MALSFSRNGKVALLGGLFIFVLITAVAVVYTKHMNRKYFSELQRLSLAKDEMNIEWGQLQLERSTFAASSIIEKNARDKLNMHQPSNKQMILLTP